MTDITPADLDLAELRALAEAATPGPWAIEPHPFGNSPARSIHVAGRGPYEFPVVNQLGCGCCDVGLDADAEDLAYIAAANPTVVLRLIDALDAVLALHKAEAMPNSDHFYCCPEDCDRAGEGELVDVCTLCYRPYPCMTVTAIEAALDGADDE